MLSSFFDLTYVDWVYIFITGVLAASASLAGLISKENMVFWGIFLLVSVLVIIVAFMQLSTYHNENKPSVLSDQVAVSVLTEADHYPLVRIVPLEEGIRVYIETDKPVKYVDITDNIIYDADMVAYISADWNNDTSSWDNVVLHERSAAGQP